MKPSTEEIAAEVARSKATRVRDWWAEQQRQAAELAKDEPPRRTVRRYDLEIRLIPPDGFALWCAGCGDSFGTILDSSAPIAWLSELADEHVREVHS